MFVTSQGSPQSRLKRALAAGNPLLVRAAAAELPQVGLDDALAICLVLLESEPGRYEPAAVRFLGRLLLERRVLTLEDTQLAARWLGELRDPGEGAAAVLGLAELCDDVGLVGAAGALRQRVADARRPGV